MSSNNMYRVGDFVYFEVSAAAPYQIRKIEELNKAATGAVEAKVVCFYRRRDLSQNLISLADKHQEELLTSENKDKLEWLTQVRHRELFLSRHLETLPATHIRGKCSVLLHNESEPYDVYLSKEDSFFFQLVYDPYQKTLQADRGTIREGSQYQADVEPFARSDPGTENEDDRPREEMIWNPANGMSPPDVDSYLLLARSLSCLGRAFYPHSALRQPNLAMSAAAAFRDTTHQLALDYLHSAGYSTCNALQRLSPGQQPTLKLDEMEQWSASEGNLFEEALEKYGKCFYDIQCDYLPWKHLKNLVEFYYMWKTTDHYIQQKRIKATEAEHNLKQVYIPNYNKPSPATLYPPPSNAISDPLHIPLGCEACLSRNSVQWYALGSTSIATTSTTTGTARFLKICTDCWGYWKRYGDLKASATSALLVDGLTDSTSATVSLPDCGRTQKPDEPPNFLTNLGSVKEVDNSIDFASRPLEIHPHTSDKTPRTGVGFHFIAVPSLRAARRQYTELDLRKQARRPFMRMGSTSQLARYTPTSTVVSHQYKPLGVSRQSRSGSDNQKASERLDAIVKRLLPNPLSSGETIKPELRSLNNREPADSAHHSLKLAMNGLVSDPSSTKTVNSRKRNHPSIEDICESEVSLPKKPTCELGSLADNENGIATSTPNKATVLLTGADSKYNPTLVNGPKRRFTVSNEVNGAITLMFRATTTVKLNRRKLLTTSELRRLSRRPWSASTHSPLENHSAQSGTGRVATIQAQKPLISATGTAET